MLEGCSEECVRLLDCSVRWEALGTYVLWLSQNSNEFGQP